jgi:hypothetical protein
MLPAGQDKNQTPCGSLTASSSDHPPNTRQMARDFIKAKFQTRPLFSELFNIVEF